MGEADYDIQVIDNLLNENEISQMYDALNGHIWSFGWPLKPMTNKYKPPFHAFIAGTGRRRNECAKSQLLSNERFSFLHTVWERTAEQHFSQQKLVGVYANGQLSAQDGRIHIDNALDSPGKTLVIFGNEFWPSSWGGALNFYNKDQDEIIKSVLPKPGRAVIFNGSTPHKGCAPSPDSQMMRMTVAFKTNSEGDMNV